MVRVKSGGYDDPCCESLPPCEDEEEEQPQRSRRRSKEDTKSRSRRRSGDDEDECEEEQPRPRRRSHDKERRHHRHRHLSRQDKQRLSGFEQCTVNDSEPGMRINYVGEGPPKGRFDPYLTLPMQPHTPSQMITAAHDDEHKGLTKKESPTDKLLETGETTFFHFDFVALGILIAYVLAIATVVVAAWTYQQDSDWNSVVASERHMARLDGEKFFSGKMLYFNAHDSTLNAAKMYLVRGDRWLEIIHLTFFSSFLLFAIFQFAAYVTRGSESHMRSVVFFYSVYGGLALLASLFPLLSWHVEETGYRLAAQKLDKFASRIFTTPENRWEAGINNGTAHDAVIIADIMKFCSIASDGGLSFKRDSRYLQLFGKKYTLQDFQTFGFCTHYRFKLIVSLLTGVFALVCCAIPCIFCFENAQHEKPGPEGAEMGKKMGEGGTTGQAPYTGGPQQRHHRQGEPRIVKGDGSAVTPAEMEFVKQFRGYINDGM